jgi:putative ABC transport system substrate-binding protein
MRRREFITLIGGAAVWPFAVGAQQPEPVRRIGVLGVTLENDPQSSRRAIAFQEGLEKLGWTVGRNLQIDYRWDASDNERARAAAEQLISLGPEVVVANSPPAVRGTRQVSRTLPIVFVAVSEPLALGLVASLAKPGGNITGFTNLEPSVAGKWLELLKEIAPGVKRAAFMFNLEASPLAPLFFRSAGTAASKFGVEPIVINVREVAEIEAAMTKLGREPGAGLILPPDTFTAANHKLIVELALRNRLPAIAPFQYFAAAGGLISYGPDVVDQFRRAASYVDRILRGEKAGDLPVQQPTKFELAINLKTAKALGLSVPPSLLARADEVIE